MLKPQSIERYKELLANNENEYNEVRTKMQELDDYAKSITMKEIDAPESVWEACKTQLNTLYKRLDELTTSIAKAKSNIKLMELEIGSTISFITYGNDREYLKDVELVDKSRSGITVKNSDSEIKISYNKVNNFSI